MPALQCLGARQPRGLRQLRGERLPVSQMQVSEPLSPRSGASLVCFRKSLSVGSSAVWCPHGGGSWASRAWSSQIEEARAGESGGWRVGVGSRVWLRALFRRLVAWSPESCPPVCCCPCESLRVPSVCRPGACVASPLRPLLPPDLYSGVSDPSTMTKRTPSCATPVASVNTLASTSCSTPSPAAQWTPLRMRKTGRR